MKSKGLLILAIGLFLCVQFVRAGWEPVKRLTWTSGESDRPAVAVDSSGNLHVVWQDSTPGNKAIYYKKSTDKGATWTTSRRLTWTSGSASYPAIISDASGDLHLVWNDDTPGVSEIYYRKSTDEGTTWTTTRRLTWTSGESVYPAIAADASNNLHLAWSDGTPGNIEIYYKRSTDGGTTWTTSQRRTWSAQDSYEPGILADPSGNIHICWTDGSVVDFDVYYKRSTDSGNTWKAGQRLTWTEYLSVLPAIAVDSSGSLYLAWFDNATGAYEICGKKSTDAGATWTAARRLTWTAGSSETPSIAVDPWDNLYLVWVDSTPGNYDIYYRMSTDAGATWTASQRITWTSEDSRHLAIAPDSSGNIHLVWSEYSPENLEVYYKRGN